MSATGTLGMETSTLGDTGIPGVVLTSTDGATAINDGVKALNEKPKNKTRLPPPSSDQEEKKIQKNKTRKQRPDIIKVHCSIY